MADQGAPEGRAVLAVVDGHRVVDADEGCGDGAAQDVPEEQRRDDQVGDGRGAPPATAGRVSDAALVTAFEGLTRTQWAILKELRNGAKYRKANPPALPSLGGDRLAWCEQCGAWCTTFDELVHHQFTNHNDIFVEEGTLAFAVEPCMCSRCDPTSYAEFVRGLGKLPAVKVNKDWRPS